MNRQQIAKYIWEHRVSLKFGECADWNEDTFKYSWFKRKYNDAWVVGGRTPGWYWFETEIDTINTFRHIAVPQTLPHGGCNIRETSLKNTEIFKSELCHDFSSLGVVYNGHEGMVQNRIRSHFALNNNKTGAIGIKHYKTLSTQKWRVSFFHVEMLEDSHLNEQQRLTIKAYAEDKAGRCAIESEWRSIFEWPVLCKQ